MTNRSFLIRAGISLALLGALPLFASASMLGMIQKAEPVVVTEEFSAPEAEALAQADAPADQPSTATPVISGGPKSDVASGSSARVPANDGPASFTGEYSGTGQASDVNGWDSPCTSSTITVLESATNLKLSNQKYSCGSLGATHGPIDLLKKADGLYLGDKKVGLYSATEIDAMLPFEHLKDVSFVFRLIKKGDSLVYTEDWLSLDQGAYTQAFEMGATLKPSAPTALR